MIWERLCQDILVEFFRELFFPGDRRFAAGTQWGRGRAGYVASDATPLRLPTERSTRSASARMSSGESLRAGIM